MLDALTRALIFPRYVMGPRSGAPDWPHLERHYLPTDQGDVEYWFVRADARLGRGPRPAVLFAHGNGELIDHWPGPLSRYHELGVHLVLVEYRGYGDSAGTPSEARLVDDFLRVIRRVAARDDVDAGALLYHGRSLGGGVVCAASRRAPPAGLILQSAFVTLHAVARRFGAPRWLLVDKFDNAAALRELGCPCLIFHGDADTLIPVEHAHALQESNALARLRVFSGADHNTPLHSEPAYWEHIASLLSVLSG